MNNESLLCRSGQDPTPAPAFRSTNACRRVHEDHIADVTGDEAGHASRRLSTCRQQEADVVTAHREATQLLETVALPTFGIQVDEWVVFPVQVITDDIEHVIHLAENDGLLAFDTNLLEQLVQLGQLGGVDIVFVQAWRGNGLLLLLYAAGALERQFVLNREVFEGGENMVLELLNAEGPSLGQEHWVGTLQQDTGIEVCLSIDF